MSKQNITREFNELKKYHWTVINMNSHKTQPTRGSKGFVDYVMFNNRQIVFIEVKIGKDKLSPEQLDTMTKLKSISGHCGNMNYYLIHDTEEAKELVDYLLEGSNGA